MKYHGAGATRKRGARGGDNRLGDTRTHRRQFTRLLGVEQRRRNVSMVRAGVSRAQVVACSHGEATVRISLYQVLKRRTPGAEITRRAKAIGESVQRLRRRLGATQCLIRFVITLQRGTTRQREGASESGNDAESGHACTSIFC